MKQKLKFAITRLSKTAKVTQNNQTPTSFSKLVTNRMDNLYLNINSSSVNNSSHSRVNGRFGKVNRNAKVEFSVPNHASQSSGKSHSNMFTPSKKFRGKYASNLKMKSLESNDHKVSKKQHLKKMITRPQVSLLNNNSMSTNGETMIKLYVSNRTKNNANHAIEELHPGKWQMLSMKYNRQMPSSISKPRFQSQNQPNIIQRVQNLWKEAKRIVGNRLQSDDKISAVLLIQAMAVLQKFYHAMSTDMVKSERRKLEVVVKKVEWVWQKVQVNKRNNKKWASDKAKKLKSRNYASLQRWPTTFRPRKDADADKIM